MDSDSHRCEQITKGTNEKNDGPKQKAISGNRKFNGRIILLATRIRRAFHDNNETNQLLLDYGFYFLLSISIIVYPIFFIFS